ncbi:MAG: hypothetical protein ABJM29_12830 [Rhizobiaceae bacterium]
MAAHEHSFDVDYLVSQLKSAVEAESPGARVKSILQEEMRDPDRVRAGMPDFEEDDVILFEDDEISIWFCRFMPGKNVPPHDHQMMATIGVYSGAESNRFFENDPQGTIRESSEVVVSAGEVLQIGPSAIHAVSCASAEPCCGIHVYLGRLTKVERSLFDVPNGQRLKFTDENYQQLISQSEV